MFSHIFLTRLKCIFRDRGMIFWAFVFPLLLATLFRAAFSNLSSAWNFSRFDVAVVDSAAFRGDAAFNGALDAVDGKSTTKGSQVLMRLTYCSRGRADELLKDGKVAGVIDYAGGPKLIIDTTGIDQSILKAFLDQYTVTTDAAKTIIAKNPAAAAAVMSSAMASADFLKDTPLTKAKPDSTLGYYYALLAMTCLYGGLMGLQEVSFTQANLTPQGARVSIAPVKKSKLFLGSICAAAVAQFVCVLALIALLAFVFGIDFGGKVPAIILAGAVGSLTGVSFGAFLGAVLKKGEGIKTGVLIGSTLVMSFLSGLMVGQMKDIVAQHAPVLAVLNPANAIADSFYSLYYYDTYSRFLSNMAILLCFSAVFFFAVFLIMRRQRYESI